MHHASPTDTALIGTVNAHLGLLSKTVVDDADEANLRVASTSLRYLFRCERGGLRFRGAEESRHPRHESRMRCTPYLHTHGDENGIAIWDDVRGSRLPQGFEWEEFVGLFQGSYGALTPL